jgi:hypothetical protein
LFGHLSGSPSKNVTRGSLDPFIYIGSFYQHTRVNRISPIFFSHFLLI